MGLSFIIYPPRILLFLDAYECFAIVLMKEQGKNKERQKSAYQSGKHTTNTIKNKKNSMGKCSLAFTKH